jgi:hypothetical protein
MFLPGPVEHGFHQRRMPIQRVRDLDRYTLVDAAEIGNDSGQVSREVNTRYEEVRNDDNALRPGFGEFFHSAAQVGHSDFEKGGNYAHEIAPSHDIPRNVPHGLIRSFN